MTLLTDRNKLSDAAHDLGWQIDREVEEAAKKYGVEARHLRQILGLRLIHESVDEIVQMVLAP